MVAGTYGSYEKAPPKYSSEVSYAAIMSVDYVALEFYTTINRNFEAIEERNYLGHEANLMTALESRRWCSESSSINKQLLRQPARRLTINPPKLC